MGGTVIPFCGSIPLSTFFLLGCFTSSLIGLDAHGSLNHLNSRRVDLAWSSLLCMFHGDC
jgi:hypothetical protein